MTSKELAKALLLPFRHCANMDKQVTLTLDELNQLQESIEKFLLDKFEEGRHVGRDHDGLVKGEDGEFYYETKRND